MTSPPLSSSLAVDLYTQALKSLSERHLNDSKELAPRSTNLPIGIARELIKISDTKKKHKKSSSLGYGEQANDSTTFGNVESSKTEEKSSRFWEKMEAYFRTVQESDIESLMYKGLDESLFFIPSLEREKVEFQENVSLRGNGTIQEKKIEQMEIDSVDTSLALIPEVVEDHKKEEVGAINEEKEEEQDASECAYSSWVLGSQKKTFFTTQRPTKKRKLFGNEGGLELLLRLPHPEKSGSVFCDVCYMQIENIKSNNVISCNVCHVSVHKKCYGLHGTEEKPWSCYLCNNLEGKGSCMFCPKQIGALKPVSGDYKNEKEKKYAHLFCSIWYPETHIKDIETMEPVMNVGAVPDIRWKLVCNACNVKHGVCIRCSIGTCRTAFHPICAREARYQMEIWGKAGYEDVELRAYCSKHSTFQEVAMPPPNKPLKLKVKCKGKDIIQGSIEQSGSKEMSKVEASLESPKNAAMSSSNNISVEVPENGANGQTPDTLDLISVVNKLVSQGKITVGDIASEVDISPDLLGNVLKGESSSFLPKLRLKMLKLLQESACCDTPFQKLKSSNGSAISLGAAAVDCSSAFEVSNTVNIGSCSFEQLSSLDRMNKEAVALTEDRKISPLGENGLQPLKGESANDIGKVSTHAEAEKVDVGKMPHILDSSKSKDKALLRMTNIDGQYTHTSPSLNPDQVQSSEAKDNSNLLGKRELPGTQYQSEYAKENACFGETAEEKKRISRSCVHPIIQKKMLQVPKVVFAKKGGRELNSDGQSEEETITGKTSGSCNHSSSSSYNDLSRKLDSEKMDQLTKAKELGILKSSPKDEIESEIIYLQNKLLDTAISIHHGSEDLLVRVVKKLPQELYALKKRQWDLVSVNNYLSEVKEEKKQERKERKHREAQAVLATATAAAATSSRLLRKDGNHDTNHPDSENPQINYGHRGAPRRVSLLFSLGPKLKETSRSSIIKTSPDKHTEENAPCCDICRQPETLLNRLFVCSCCKVAVHVHCYQKNKDPPVGPWKCELCEEISQTESPLNQGLIGIKCGLCGGEGSDAFRKATSGQWVHAFCAEWLLESTFKRGQSELIDGMDSLPKEKGLHTCSVCHQNMGFCVKCSYGHCQVAFHPSCAKAARFYMSINGISGSIHHKGYCEKHSADQRLKADNQQCGSEELKSIKHLRFELEKLRILCERIVKREKIKKDIVVCSQEILAYRWECLGRPVRHVKGSAFLPGVSSESATTSFDNKSDSGIIQRSEDITVDSTVSGKHGKKNYLDDGSTSQLTFKKRIPDRTSCSGKKFPTRTQSLSFRNSDSEGEKIKVKKPVENFHKEVVMTSHQASVQNRRLPKGFVYVPIDSLSKEKSVRDTKSREPEEPGG